MPFISSGAARLAFDVSGDGQPVIFLHAGVADRRMWAHQLSTIGQTRRAFAYDRRGFGHTTWQPEPHADLDDLFAVLDAVAGDGPAILVGCSLGGGIALDAVLAQPDRVSALALIAPAISGAPALSFPRSARKLIVSLGVAESDGDIERVNEIEAHLWLDGPLSPAGRVEGDARRLFLEMNGIALRAETVGEARGPRAAYQQLGQIGVPTLAIWGEHDLPYFKDRCEDVARGVQRGEICRMNAVAHLPSVEKPEETSAILKAFLDRVGAA
jgi:pimeloyl-ACP methyl ester carboxylesterase